MKLLVDMNLSPEWLKVFAEAGWEANHWKDVGSPTSPDVQVMEWAKSQRFIVITQDLDFAQVLFHTQAGGPSVVLLRIHDQLDSVLQGRVCRVLRAAAEQLETGALLVIDERRARLRLLPLRGE